jgi:hypothetical protein
MKQQLQQQSEDPLSIAHSQEQPLMTTKHLPRQRSSARTQGIHNYVDIDFSKVFL